MGARVLTIRREPSPIYEVARKDTEDAKREGRKGLRSQHASYMVAVSTTRGELVAYPGREAAFTRYACRACPQRNMEE